MQVEAPDGSVSFPHPIYDDVVREFVQVASEDHWCDFDYSPATTGELLDDPTFVAQASIDQVKSMLTWCVRGERFCSGHWGDVIQSGKVRLLLERLTEIRAETDTS